MMNKEKLPVLFARWFPIRRRWIFLRTVLLAFTVIIVLMSAYLPIRLLEDRSKIMEAATILGWQARSLQEARNFLEGKTLPTASEAGGNAGRKGPSPSSYSKQEKKF